MRKKLLEDKQQTDSNELANRSKSLLNVKLADFTLKKTKTESTAPEEEKRRKESSIKSKRFNLNKYKIMDMVDTFEGSAKDCIKIFFLFLIDDFDFVNLIFFLN